MKQRKPLNIGDRVKVFGYGLKINSDTKITHYVVNRDVFYTVSYVNTTTESFRFKDSCDTEVAMHRNQVTKVIRKVKPAAPREWWLVNYSDGRLYNIFTKESLTMLAHKEIPGTELFHVREVRKKK